MANFPLRKKLLEDLVTLRWSTLDILLDISNFTTTCQLILLTQTLA